MTAAAVALCNEALRLLGDASIASFDEGSDLANSCSTIYQTTISGLIAAHPWRFSMRKQQLARQAVPPLTGWSYAHQLPAELVVLRALFASPAPRAAPVTDFDRFDRDVLSQHPDLWCDHQVLTEPPSWPPLFRTLARYALAADLAVPATGSLTAADAFFRRAYGGPAEGGNGGAMRVARTAEAQQQTHPVIRDFALIQARFGGWR